MSEYLGWILATLLSYPMVFALGWIAGFRSHTNLTKKFGLKLIDEEESEL